MHFSFCLCAPYDSCSNLHHQTHWLIGSQLCDDLDTAEYASRRAQAKERVVKCLGQSLEADDNVYLLPYYKGDGHEHKKRVVWAIENQTMLKDS